MLSYILVLVSVVGFGVSAPVIKESALGSYISVCDAKAADLNDCVLRNTNKLLPKIKNGLREIDFGPIDPMKIPLLDIGQDDGVVFLKLALINTVHKGLSRTKFHQASINMKTLEWKLNGTIPRYTIEGEYQGKGKILLVPLSGAGVANITVNDLSLGLNIFLSKKKVDNKLYLYVDKAKVTVGFTQGRNVLDIKQKTGGDARIAQFTGKFIRENGDEVLASTKKTFEEVYSQLLTQMLRRVFNKVPYSLLFKET